MKSSYSDSILDDIDPSSPKEGESISDTQSRAAKKKKHRFVLSYDARIILVFSIIAALTTVTAIGVVSSVWEQHFQSYAESNMRAVSTVIAERIAVLYKKNHNFSIEALEAAESVMIIEGVEVQVRDERNVPIFDSSQDPPMLLNTSALSGGKDSPLAHNDDEKSEYYSPEKSALLPGRTVNPYIRERLDDDSAVAISPIVHNGKKVGEVRVWVDGSDTLMRSEDKEFRNKSYQAMLLAGIIAILLASSAGVFLSRSLTWPIKRMIRTTDSIAKGDFTKRYKVEGEDEIARLSQSIDAMADTIERDRRLEKRLTTDVAHELRTPLMAIQATVEAMVDGVLPADEERLNTVDSEVKRLSRMVDSILRLSRLENRRTYHMEDNVDISDVLADCIATHEMYAQEIGLTLNFECEEGIHMRCDPDLIRQCIANLMSNAFRYTDKGGKVEVSVKRDGDQVRIAVSDTGIGLDEEEIKHVFQRFWRADSDRSRASGGLGIGLSVVQEIVTHHGGKLLVDSEKGKGSCFTLLLPLENES